MLDALANAMDKLAEMLNSVIQAVLDKLTSILTSITMNDMLSEQELDERIEEVDGRWLTYRERSTTDVEIIGGEWLVASR